MYLLCNVQLLLLTTIIRFWLHKLLQEITNYDVYTQVIIYIFNRNNVCTKVQISIVLGYDGYKL